MSKVNKKKKNKNNKSLKNFLNNKWNNLIQYNIYNKHILILTIYLKTKDVKIANPITK